MKNVLFIVYYFPPMGGSGVQRPLKFVKYLKEFGWNPVVLCPEPGAYHTFDNSLKEELDSLEVEVHRVQGNTPLHKSGDREVRLPKSAENALRKVSTFFWLPDNKKGWIKPGLEKAKELIVEKDIEVVFSTAAPYSNLMLAAELKKETGVKVVMDLRDEWLESHLIKYPTALHKKRMAKIEKKTLTEADVITVINDAYKESFGSRFPEADIRVISQGFDPEDFEETDKSTVSDKLRILYSGLFYGDRSPNLFLEAVASILKEQEGLSNEIELWFQGGLDENITAEIEKLGLSELVKDFGYLDHKEAVQNLLKADVLWLMVGHMANSDKVTVGKMFEYFGAGNPILALIPEGASTELLKNYGAYYQAHPQSFEEIKSALESLIDDFRNKKLPVPNKEFISRYNRKEITAELASVFNVISS